MKKQQKYTLEKWMLLALFSLIVLGCNSIQDTYKQFVMEGETIYIGTADTVYVDHGFNRLRFHVAINADPKISKGLLRTIDGSVMHEFDVERRRNGQDTVSFEVELPEGEYTFGLYLMDQAGNRSVRREVPATVYGENYQNSLVNRIILNVDAYSEDVVIEWAEPNENMVRTVVKYEDDKGVVRELEVLAESNRTVVEGYKLGGEVVVQSFFKPTTRAIDEFEALPSASNFPTEYQLDKSLISALRLPGDASEGCYGSSYANLFNGSTDDFWHSCEDAIESPEDLYPLVMSFDLGDEVSLSRFRLDERTSCCGERSPSSYQVWGINDIENAQTVDIDQVGIDEWEIDALAKGWVKLVDVKENQQYSFEVDIPEDNTTYRYVRFVGISSIGGGEAANFSEFTFYGR